MVVFAELALVHIESLGNRQETVDDRRAGCNNVAPVKLRQRGLREEVKVLLELTNAANGGGRTMGSALLVRECHNVLGLFVFGLRGEVSSPCGDAAGIIREERQDVYVGVVESRVMAVLREDTTESCFVLAIRLHDLDHGLVCVLENVTGKLSVRDR